MADTIQIGGKHIKTWNYDGGQVSSLLPVDDAVNGIQMIPKMSTSPLASIPSIFCLWVWFSQSMPGVPLAPDENTKPA